MVDVAVIGGGVVGALTARALSRYELSICILEKEEDVAMGASAANSGIVHAGFDAAPGTLMARMNVCGSEMMPQIAEELGVKYQNNGSLVIAFSKAELEMLEALRRRGEKNGVKSLEIVTEERLWALEPGLSKRVKGALYAPSGGIICPYGLAIAAVGNAMDNGVQLKCGFRAEKISQTADGFEIQSERETVNCRYLVNAAGLWADEVSALAGAADIKIRPRKGQYLILDKACGGLVQHTIFRTPSPRGKGILVSPTVDGNLLLGPTSETIEDKSDTGTTAEGLEKIMRETLENVPGLPLKDSITSFSGLRAAGNRGDFILDCPRPKMVRAAGIESPGLSSAPAIAEYMVTLLKQEGLRCSLRKDFQPRRRALLDFRELSMEEKNQVIRRNPAYGKIVCRCEMVSEGEILDAIRQNPRAKTLDAVKRRTRSGMGRCQGGFCSPLVMELLAREWGIPIEELTKSGGASKLLAGKTK